MDNWWTIVLWSGSTKLCNTVGIDIGDLLWSISVSYTLKAWLLWKFLVELLELGGGAIAPIDPPWLRTRVLTCLMRLIILFRFFPIFVIFTNMPRALALRLTTSGANATHHLQTAPSWISLWANHLNTTNHFAFGNVASASRCVPQENRMKMKESSCLPIKFFGRVHSENVPQSSLCH